MTIIIYIYIISFSQEWKPIFAYSTEPLICKSQKTFRSIVPREKLLKKAQI